MDDLTSRGMARILLAAKGVRAFGDGFVALLLPVYLSALGFDAFAIGVLTTATLLGSALLTLAAGFAAHRMAPRRLLLAASLLMLATGLAFAGLRQFWPLLLVGFIGTLNPTAGDVSLFLPLEQALLAEAGPDARRTALFARYSLVGSLSGALGALAAGAPDLARHWLGIDAIAAIRAMLVLYGLLGVTALFLYRRLPARATASAGSQPLRQSRRRVLVLAGLFSIDAFGGGFFVQSLLALWLFDRFGLSLAAAASFFFWAGALTALSYPVAARIAGRVGLVNTMVFTHIPSSVCLILAAFSSHLGIVIALLLIRAALSQMDVPTRTSYVMAVVTPEERPAAASVTAVPRSLASSLSPALSGVLLATPFSGLPLIACGVLKIVYDLALLHSFRHTKPPEEV